MNRRKHGVAFEEGMTIFDTAPLILEDEEHSWSEDRYIAIGFSEKQRLLSVVFTYRGRRVRIISARKADRDEANRYAKAKS
jgi:uncharacterized DUF497 family protein